MIVFLFGLPGVGKTYLGKLLQRKLGAYYWDGDEALTTEMRLAVKNEQPFSATMTEDLSNTIIGTINTLKQSHSLIIVSQAMLLESDRQMFREHFEDISFIYIKCDLEHARQRIVQRADFVTESYFNKLVAAFEPHRTDAEAYPSIDNYNKSDEQLIREFNSILDQDLQDSWDPGFFQTLKSIDDGISAYFHRLVALR